MWLPDFVDASCSHPGHLLTRLVPTYVHDDSFFFYESLMFILELSVKGMYLCHSHSTTLLFVKSTTED
jgi:hypothetical protein